MNIWEEMEKLVSIIAVDFDGTLVVHKYPEIGDVVPLAFETLKVLQMNGHRLILSTMRSGKELEEAVEFCKEIGIEFWGVNENPDQSSWTSSPKVFAHLYIDDTALGCPVIPQIGARPAVNWAIVVRRLRQLGLLSENDEKIIYQSIMK